MKNRRVRLTGLLCLLIVAAGCTSGDDDDVAADKPERDCDPARPHSASSDPQSFEFDGEDRSYLLALPADYDGATAIPLVFNFHGHGGSKEKTDASTELSAKGTERGYAVVTADALGEPQAWNMFGDEGGAKDYEFVNALIEDLSKNLCIDSARIFAAGHSNGSAFTGFLACEEPYPFAAIAMVAAAIPPLCPDDTIHSALLIHGTADPGVPYDGGSVAGGPVQIPPVEQTLDDYGREWECDPMQQDEPQDGIELRKYTGCAKDREAMLYTVIDGSHDWPTGEFDATDAILDFFDTHPS